MSSISGAYNPVNCSVNKLNMSAAFDKINESILPANNEGDKQLQKIMLLVKIREGGKTRGCHPLGEKNLIR